jgi:hypothetical protein
MSQLLEQAPNPDCLQETNLPILATANDVRELVQFLKKRPSGVCISDVAQPIKKRIFYHKKVAAYEFWGIVSKSGEHLKLSPLGWKFAESLEPEAQIYRRLLAQTTPYWSFLAELHRQQIDVVTHEDVARYWTEHHPGSIILHEGAAASGPVVCFFHLCQAAELGTMTIGKRGQPARLRILHDELGSYLGQTPSFDSDALATTGPAAIHAQSVVNTFGGLKRLRIYISVPSEYLELANQISEILFLDDIDSEIVSRNGSTASGLVSDNALEALRRCHAAIIVVPVGDDCNDLTAQNPIREPALNEISAAFVLYDRRVVMLTEANAGLPAVFKDLKCCTYEGDTPTWTTFFELLKIVKGFHKQRSA